MEQNDCREEDADKTRTKAVASEESFSPTTMHGKSQSLAEIAENTFRELSNTLEIEQNKLMDLEERRKKLQEEMQRLKTEIEEEKKVYQLNVMQSVGEHLKALSNENEKQDEQQLDCQPPVEGESTIEEHTAHIKIQLQHVLEQCIHQQRQTADSDEGESLKGEGNPVEDSI